MLKELIENETNEYAKDFYKLLQKEKYSILEGAYKNTKEKVKVICPNGHVYDVRPNRFKQGTRCSKCHHGSTKKKQAQILDKLLKSEGYEIVEGAYNGVRSKVKLKCPNDHLYEVQIGTFMKGSRCFKCLHKSIHDKYFDVLKSEMEKDNYSLVSGEYYKGANEHLSVICSNGHKYKTTPHNFAQGHRCKTCDGSAKLTTDIFKKRVYENVGNEYTVLGNYEGSKVHILMKHENESCGFHEWKASPMDFIHGGRRCPKCKASKGEKRISRFLNEYNIKHETEKTFDGLEFEGKLRYDFFIPIKNLLIEYDGKQHFEAIDFASKGKAWAEKIFEGTKKRDEIKNAYAKENNIRLLRIPYWEFDDIESILSKELKNLIDKAVF